MEFWISDSSEPPMLLGAPPVIHPGQRRDAPQIPLPHPTLPPLLQVCSLHGCLQQPSVLLILILASCSNYPPHMVTRETFPKHRVKWDPALHTCEVSLHPPGGGLDLKPDFPGQILPCQFYISMMLGKLVT